MTREEFKEILEDKGYSYEEKENKIIVKHIGDVNLGSLQTLPDGITFSNSGFVGLGSLQILPEGIIFSNGGNVILRSLLRSLQTLPKGTVFSNGGNVNLGSLLERGYLSGGWFEDWTGNIEGIDDKRLLNKMIKDGLFDRK
jgi:hypothetical protein